MPPFPPSPTPMPRNVNLRQDAVMNFVERSLFHAKIITFGSKISVGLPNLVEIVYLKLKSRDVTICGC